MKFFEINSRLVLGSRGPAELPRESMTKFKDIKDFTESLRELVREIKSGSKVCVLVHGYRSGSGITTLTYNVLANEVANDYDYVIGFKWPASWAYVGFWRARRRAHKASSYLNVLVSLLVKLGANITVVGHSLGCKVIQEASVQAHEQWRNLKVIYTGAAIHTDDFKVPSNDFYNLYSSRDWVLTILRGNAVGEGVLGQGNMHFYEYDCRVGHSDYKRHFRLRDLLRLKEFDCTTNLEDNN